MDLSAKNKQPSFYGGVPERREHSYAEGNYFYRFPAGGDTSLSCADGTYFLSPRKKVSKESSRLNLLNDQPRNMNVSRLSDSYCYRRVSKLRPDLLAPDFVHYDYRNELTEGWTTHRTLIKKVKVIFALGVEVESAAWSGKPGPALGRERPKYVPNN